MHTRRLEALSDSTFAVALTLLIFDVRVLRPRVNGVTHDLWFGEWPHYIGYLVSFSVIGMIWINHHSVFRMVRRIDNTGMVLNLAFLGLIVFIPFPTQTLATYLAAYPQRGDFVATFYGLCLAACTLVLAVLWHHLERRPDLLRRGDDPVVLSRLTRRLYMTPALYAAAAGLSLLNHWVGIALYVGIACGYLLHTGTRAFPGSGEELVEVGADA
ncbi:MAG: TMEM175 family protein [Acidimicrobiales bacterium]